jgi:diguanylate cyclase (GGDEF)-like protein
MRLLIVEDDTEHQRLLLLALSAGGAPLDARVVATRADFLDAVRRDRFDCVLMDFHIPPHQAPDLIREAAACLAETPVVVISSSQEQDVVIRSLRTGVADFVSKYEALDGPALRRRIQSAIASASARREERRRGDRRLRAVLRSAETDPLTGLSNRRYAHRLLRSNRFRSDRRTVTSCLLFDVDRFKAVNDAHGHAAGDLVLQQVADVLKRNAGANEAVVRWGGEEFLVLLPSTSLTRAWLWADRVRREIAGLDFRVAETTSVSITVSCGLASIPTCSLCEASVVLADRALYLAKEHGRDRVTTWLMVQAFEAAEELHSIPTLSATERLNRLIDRLRPSLGDAQCGSIGPHSELVRGIALQIGRAMRLPSPALALLSDVARLHDIGKVAIPEDLLGKPTTLTPEEKAFVDDHTRFGAQIAQALGSPASVSRALQSQHHHFDAAPAHPDPDHLAETLGHIIAVADAVAAMITDHPYAHRRSLAQALAELRRLRGVQFDPDVVDTIHFVDRAVLAQAA